MKLKARSGVVDSNVRRNVRELRGPLDSRSLERGTRDTELP